MGQKAYLVLLSLVLVPAISVGIASAQTAPVHCEVSPHTTRVLDHYPRHDDFYLGNNLVQPAGKPVAYEGQKLILKGRVLDAGCKAVGEAAIELWQADNTGRYVRYDRKQLANPEATFTGSGKSISNNLGEFEFISLFPEAEKDTKKPRAPRVHLAVKHPALKAYISEFYFENERRNDDDTYWQSLSEKERQQLSIKVSQDPHTKDIIGYVTIVLDGKVPFKQF